MGDPGLKVGLWLHWQESLGQIANIVDWQSRRSTFSAGQGLAGELESRCWSRWDIFSVSCIRHSWTRYWSMENINEQPQQLCPNMTWQATMRKINNWCIGSTPSNMGSKKWSMILWHKEKENNESRSYPYLLSVLLYFVLPFLTAICLNSPSKLIWLHKASYRSCPFDLW